MPVKTPSLSIVLIVNRTHADTMHASVKSIEEQSRQPLERVVVFDSSESIYLRDWICLNGDWNDFPSCVNFSISKTKADFIAIITADFVMPKGFIGNCLKVVRNNPDAPMIKVGMIQVWNASAIINIGCWKGTSKDMVTHLSKMNMKPANAEIQASEIPVKVLSEKKEPRLTHSVVITNFLRPEMLVAAFESCVAAKVENLVITSSGVNDEVRSVHEMILEKKPDTKIISEDGDSGCNENWIKGVEAADTDFVTILHDDDKLNPAFSQVTDFLSDDVGVIVWDGSKHGSGSENDGFYEYLPFLDDGVHDAKMAFEVLLKPNSLTLSPVGGAFRKDVLLRALIEARDNFSGSDFFIRDKMMVGNDLLLWLRCIQQSSKLRYIKKQLVSYGHQIGSISYDDSFNEESKLLPIYNRVRDYFLKDFPKIFHVVPRYKPSDISTVKRIGRAEFTWNKLYDYDIIRPVHVWEKDYLRDSSSIGDSRRTPFLKDMLQSGIDVAGDNDYVMITNDDTMIHPLAKWAIYNMMSKEEVCCAFRVSFDAKNMPKITESPKSVGRRGFVDKGRDLFVFSKGWLMIHMNQIPDYVLGSTDWDSTLGIAFRKWRSIAVTREDYCLVHPRSELPLGYIYHQDHVAFWSATQERREVVKGNVYNRELSMKFIRENGVGWVI